MDKISQVEEKAEKKLSNHGQVLTGTRNPIFFDGSCVFYRETDRKFDRQCLHSFDQRSAALHDIILTVNSFN